MFIVALKLLNSGTVDFEFYLVYQGKLLNISLLQFSHLQTMNNKLLWGLNDKRLRMVTGT